MPDLSLLAGTFNPHKLKEFRQIFQDVPLIILGLGDIEWDGAEASETGDSFEENAAQKAVYYAEATGMITLADDSGLEIMALGGRPGLFSSRYALTNDQRIARVLSEMKDVPDDQRAARFVCAMALAVPGQEPIVHTGVVNGVITRQRAGEGGFGYDPIFHLPTLNKTMAQLTNEEKNRLSHRARAAEHMKPVLRQLAGQL